MCCHLSNPFLIRRFMEEVSSGIQHIDPHNIPHFCYQEGSTHNGDQNEEFDEVEGHFGGFLLHQVSTYSNKNVIWLTMAFVCRGCDTSLLVHSQHSIYCTMLQEQRSENGGWMQSHQRWWHTHVSRYYFSRGCICVVTLCSCSFMFLFRQWRNGTRFITALTFQYFTTISCA